MTAPVVAGRSALSDLDPSLPGLAHAFDERRAAQAFASAWDTDVSACGLRSTRFEPGLRCVTSHEVEVVTGGRRRSVLGVIETAPTGTRVRRFAEDPDLPGLALAMDADRMAALLGWEDAGCRVEPVRYRPGQRAVLRYRRGAGSSCLYGKVLAGGTGGVEQALAMLQEAAATDASVPTGAPVAALDREAGLVVQAEVPGPSLHAVAFAETFTKDERLIALSRAGLALARLHGSGVAPSRRATAAEDIADLRAFLPAITCADPDLAGRFDGLVAAVDSTRADGPALPAHGAFRTDQVLLSGGRPVLLDLDGFCTAHPARDLGNVLAYLRWRAIRRPGQAALVRAARDALVAGYTGSGASLDGKGLGFYEGLSLLKIAGRRFRRLAVEEWPLVPGLLDAAGALLGVGG